MSQLDLAIAATNLQSTFGIRIDGLIYTNSFGSQWSCTHSGKAAFASCTLEVVTPFTLAPGRHRVELYAGWQGQQDLVFAGEIIAQGSGYFARHDQFTCGGYLKRLEVGLNQTYSYYYNGGTADEIGALLAFIPLDSIGVPILTDADIIIHILERYGITPLTTGHSIQASTFIPAQLLPITWDHGQPGWAIIQELDKVSPNYKTYDGRTGAVYRRQQFGTVPTSVKHTFVQGTDILDLHVARDFNVFNQVIVRGAQDPSEDSQDGNVVVGVSPVGSTPIDGITFTPPPPNPYVPNPPGYRTDETINSTLIETVSEAQTIADTWLGVVIQPLQPVNLTTFGCTDWDVGDALGVNAPVMPLTANSFAISHTVSNAPLRSVWELQASTVAEARPNQPPTPQMLITVILEHVIISGVNTPLAMITVDATTSSDSDGTIASWEIALDGQTYTGTDITTAIITRATTAPSPVPVALTVTDNGGLSSTIIQSATWDASTTLIEPLALAELVDGAASADGELSWKTFTAAVTAVAPIALGGVTAYGCSDGKLFTSADFLATTPTLTTTFAGGSQVNCLWNNETTATRWIAGLQDGTVWLSIDAAATWHKLATLAGPVNDISESPYAVGQMTAAVGAYIMQTFDGVTWTQTYGWTSNALRFAAGRYSGVDVLYSGHANGDILRHTSGGTGKVGTVPSGGAITGLTLDLHQDLVYVFTDQAASPSYSMTPAGVFTAGPTMPTATNRAMRSGSGQWIYASTDGSLRKVLFNPNSSYDIRIVTSPQRVMACGYSSVSTAPVVQQIEIIVPGTGKVWHHTPDGWTATSSGLPSGIVLSDALASPANPDYWIAWTGGGGANGGGGHILATGQTYSPMWYTKDAGASWHECLVPNAPLGGSLRTESSWSWSVDLVGHLTLLVVSGEHPDLVIYAGQVDALAVVVALSGGPYGYHIGRLRAGHAKEVYWVMHFEGTLFSGSSDTYNYIDTNGYYDHDTGHHGFIAALGVDGREVFANTLLTGTGRGAVFLTTTGIWSTPDYRTISPTLIDGFSPYQLYEIVTLADGTIWYKDYATHIFKVTGLPGTPVQTSMTAAEIPTISDGASGLRAEQRTHNVIMLRTADYYNPNGRKTYTNQGTGWVVLDDPEPSLPPSGDVILRNGVLPVLPAVAELLLGLSGAGTNSGIYHGIPESTGTTYTWTLKNSGLPSGKSVDQIKVNPLNLNEWLVLMGPRGKNSSGLVIQGTTTPALWITTNNGATFTSLALPMTAAEYGVTDQVLTVEMDYTADGGIVVGAELGGVASLHVGNGALYWWAAPATAGGYTFALRQVHAFGGSDVSGFHSITGGTTGDGVMSYSVNSEQYLGWWHRVPALPATTPVITPSGNIAPRAPGSIRRSKTLLTPRLVVAAYNDGTNHGATLVASDYQSSSYSVLSFYGGLVASRADGSWWFGSNSTSLTKVTTITSAPVVTTVSVGGGIPGPTLVSDSSGTALACYVSAAGTKTGVAVSGNGVTWVHPTPPVAGGTFDQVYASGLEAIVR